MEEGGGGGPQVARYPQVSATSQTLQGRAEAALCPAPSLPGLRRGQAVTPSAQQPRQDSSGATSPSALTRQPPCRPGASAPSAF